MVSVTMIFYTGGPQLGEVEAGIAATILGTPLSVVFGGAGTIAVTVIMAYIVPTLRRYDSHKELG
jgi:predicted ABC-type sugar transport system permease subunit